MFWSASYCYRRLSRSVWTDKAHPVFDGCRLSLEDLKRVYRLYHDSMCFLVGEKKGPPSPPALRPAA
jgi:hypothetical protein